MYKFQFYHDYYNEKGELKQLNLFHTDKNHYALKEYDGFEYLLVMDMDKPTGAIGFKVVREEGKK